MGKDAFNMVYIQQKKLWLQGSLMDFILYNPAVLG